MSNVLIERGGRTVGPFTVDEVRRYLARGSVAPHTRAWTDGLLDWAPLEQVLASAEAQRGEGQPEFTDTTGRNIVPDEVRGFSWGAFLCGPVWGFPHRLWVSILAWLPGIGVMVWLWMGFNGREIAWGSREWDSPQAFLRSERRWARVGWVIFLALLAVTIGLALVLAQRGGGVSPDSPVQTERPAAPAAEGAREQAQPQAQPQARPRPAEAAPSAQVRSRAAWRKELMGEGAGHVLALLGKPAHTEKLPDKNVDVWIYRRVSFERDASEPDAFMLVGIQAGVVAGVEFVKKEAP